MSLLKDKSFNFALDCVNLYKMLCQDKKEYVLSKQFLRSSTAIGALIREAQFAQSKPDFISKMSIALKEANETEYWLLLLFKSGFINERNFEDHKIQIDEIIRMLVSTVKTSKSKI